jgi:hypothetical protein
MITNIYLASNEIPATPWWGHMQFVALTNTGELLEMEVQMGGLKFEVQRASD